jgi:signal transduction histidine kinase
MPPPTQKKDQLENEIHSDFLDVIAHELRAPLSSIKGYASILYHNREKNLTDKQKQQLNIINKNVDKLDVLINNVLELMKRDSGAVRLYIEPIQLPEIINSVIEDFEPIILENHQEINVNIQDDLPVIYGDIHKIIQIFSNLLSNALKYTPDGGKININTDIATNDQEILVNINDNGIGISKEDQVKIFQRFYTAKTAPPRTCDRIGLGLDIVKGNIELHNGKIWVDSKPGEGSTFYFTLPSTTGVIDE